MTIELNTPITPRNYPKKAMVSVKPEIRDKLIKRKTELKLHSLNELLEKEYLDKIKEVING